MKLRSSTNFISLGLACLTLSLVLMAHSIGVAPDNDQQLLTARMQTVELVAAQCSPSAAENDLKTMGTIVRQIAAQNNDLISAGLRQKDGKLVYSFGPHNKTWTNLRTAAVQKLSVPIAKEDTDWGTVEFCFKTDASSMPAFVPNSVASLLLNPALRVGLFVAVAGFICYSMYLRRTLRYLDPNSVIPPRVRAMLDALAEGILVLDHAGQIVMANDSFSRITGLSQKSLQGSRADRLLWTEPHSTDAAASIPWMEALASGEAVKGASLGIRLQAEESQPRLQTGPKPDQAAEKDETEIAVPMIQRVFSVNAAPVLGPDGRVRGALATFDDVTELEEINLALKESRDEIQRQNFQLQLLAKTDPMTGCLNRRSFLAEFDSQWARTVSQNAVVSCVMVDVDKFKNINDRFGHTTGDSVLKNIARILIASTGGQGLVCRYGGEEFCILFPGKNLDQSSEFAQRLRQAIESEPWQITNVTASFGVASSQQGAQGVKELLDQADRALYSSKRTGRNRVTCWGNIPIETETPAELVAPLELAAATEAVNMLSPVVLLEHTSQQAFVALTSALAHRDRGTALHSRRVMKYCMMAAPGLLSADEAAHLEAAALLHDVGKLSTPDCILHKPEPLTADEWEIMRSHALIGVDLAAAAGMPPPVLFLIAAHHAKYDHISDDPTRPTRNQIPVAARLLCIVDAYDAMTTDRPYRKAMSHEEAIAELRRCAGSHFDPMIVEHFIAALQVHHNESFSARQAAA